MYGVSRQQLDGLLVIHTHEITPHICVCILFSSRLPEVLLFLKPLYHFHPCDSDCGHIFMWRTSDNTLVQVEFDEYIAMLKVWVEIYKYI